MHCLWESKLVYPLLKTVWSFLKKLKIELPYNPEIALLSIPKEIEIRISKGYLQYHVYCSIIYNNQDIKAA